MADFKASTAAEVTAALASARNNPGADTLVLTGADIAPFTLNQADSNLTIIAGAGGATFNGGAKQETAITVNGADNITIQGLTFTNTATGNDNEAVKASIVVAPGSTGLQVLDNTFTGVGAGIDTESSGSLIDGNTFTDVGSYAIRGTASSKNTISDNVLTHIAYILPEGGGIEFYGASGGNLIAHNELTNIGRDGIAFRYPDTGGAAGSGGNTIEYNIVTNAMQQDEDGGGIYSFAAPATEDIIRYNLVTNNKTAEVFGIYADDYAKAQIYGNVAQGDDGGIYVHGGKNVSVHDNISIGATRGLKVDQIDDDGLTLTGLNVSNNLVISSTQPLAAYYTSGTFASNVYVGPNNFGYDGDTFSQWQSGGRDAGSVLLSSSANEINADYSLKAGSQALAKGVDQPPLAQMGVTQDDPPPPVLDTIEVRLSQDAYGAEAAKFIFSVDGVAQNTAAPVPAIHGSGENVFTFTGDWSSSAHTFAVQYTNDVYGGSASLDRNLWIESIKLNGVSVGPASDFKMTTGGTTTWTGSDTVPSDVITLHLSQDAYAPDGYGAKFIASVDGVDINPVPDQIQAVHGSGEQVVTLGGHWGAGDHVLDIRFLNDAYGGNASLDRNLWIESNGVTVNGANYGPAADVRLTNTGSHMSFTFSDATA